MYRVYGLRSQLSTQAWVATQAAFASIRLGWRSRATPAERVLSVGNAKRPSKPTLSLTSFAAQVYPFVPMSFHDRIQSRGREKSARAEQDWMGSGAAPPNNTRTAAYLKLKFQQNLMNIFARRFQSHRKLRGTHSKAFSREFHRNFATFYFPGISLLVTRG